MDIVYYTSATGNTQRFADKLNLPSTKIIKGLMVENPFVLFCPTFADMTGRHAVPKPVIRFLNEKQNRDLIRGVVGFGNRNFGPYFAFAADTISYKCHIPILGRVELFGTKDDTELIGKRINEFRLRGPERLLNDPSRW